MIFCSKNPDARANRKGSLSSLPQQRAAEIGRKKATASCGSGREGAGGFIPAVPVHEQPAGLQRGCGFPPVPPGSQPAQKSQRGLSPASLVRLEGRRMSFWPLGLRLAPGLTPVRWLAGGKRGG